MFQSLMEPPQVTQQILAKIAHQLISKYQLHSIHNLYDFTNDLDKVIHQIKLINTSLEQLFVHQNVYQFKVLLANNCNYLRIIDFLGRTVKKVYLRVHQSTINYAHKQQSVCNICHHNIEHTNIKQLQRQILDRSPYPFQQLEEQLKYSDTHLLYDQRFATPEEVLIKKMGSLQKNINQRQANLIRCIDDFQNIRADLLIGIKKRQFDRQISSFDLKAYSLHLTKHFLNNFHRIQQKISLLKKEVHILQDKSMQTNLNQEPVAISKMQNIINKMQHSRIDVEHRKLNQQKTKLQDSCKRYQAQLKELNSKLQAIQSQNNVLRQELTTQKFKTIVKQKVAKNTQKSIEQKVKKEQQLKRQSILLLLNNQGAFAGEFTNMFLQNYLNNSTKNEQELMPIIKATFKRTFDHIMHQRMSLSLPHHQYNKTPTKRRDSEEQAVNRRRKSKKKSMRFPIQTQNKQLSRFANKKNMTLTNFAITSQLSYKILYDKLATHQSQQSLDRNSQSSNYKKSMGESGALKKKRTRYSKLNSILSQYKENHNSTDSLFKSDKRNRQIVQTQPNQPQIDPKRSLIRKATFTNVNHSKFFSQKDNVVQLGELKPPVRIKKLQGIESRAIRQFLFADDEQQQVKQGTSISSKTTNNALSIQSLLQQSNNKKSKTILNLQEINFLTQFFSILANIHISRAEKYMQIKNCILSKVDKGKLKEYQSKHHLILKKVMSQIIFKHRQCQRHQLLCPHLSQFLKEIQKQQ